MGFDILQVFPGGLWNRIFFCEISVSVEVVWHKPDYISIFIHKILQKEESNISVEIYKQIKELFTSFYRLPQRIKLAIIVFRLPVIPFDAFQG